MFLRNFSLSVLLLSLAQVPQLKSKDDSGAISTGRMLSDIGVGLAVVPLIAFLTSIAIAQAFSRKNQYTINPSQELIALGISNIAGSFVSGFPIAGCFSRTTVNSISGVATPFGGRELHFGCISNDLNCQYMTDSVLILLLSQYWIFISG